MVANFSRTPQGPIALGGAAFAEKIINKHYTMTNETVLADVHQFANETVRLDFCARPDRYVPLNFCKWSDKNTIPKDATIHVGWKDDFDVGSIHYIDEARFENYW